MRVVILTWEYPPKWSGTVSNHVSALAHELVKRKQEVEIVTVDDWRPGFEDVLGVHVHRVANHIKTHPMASILTSALTASIEIEREASNIVYFYRQQGKDIDLVHAHEWLVIPSAICLKHALGIPFVMTLHSVEGHRCHDNFDPKSIAVKEIEDMGIWESAKVIANTEWLKNEILRYFGGGHEQKIDVVWPIGENWVDEILGIYQKSVQHT
jgi:glycogen(starch) synthase